MICSTSCMTRLSWWWPGTGCGATRGSHGRGGWRNRLLRRRPCGASRPSSPSCEIDLKARKFHPLPVREVMIPKPGRQTPSFRYRHRAGPGGPGRPARLVLEPIFEADFQPCSYGFRPERRAQDAIAEIHFYTTRSYEWVVEGDIKACFDEISHSALMDRVRDRIGDKRVLALVKAFLKAGILGEDGVERDSSTGTPQGGILLPVAQQRGARLSSTSSSPGRQEDRRANLGSGRSAASKAVPTTGWSGMPIYAELGISRLMPRPGLCRPGCRMRLVSGGWPFLGRHNPVGPGGG